MKTYRAGTLLGMLWFVTACVTINIYFPTAEAVEAADQIIKGVYGKDQTPETVPDVKPKPDAYWKNHESAPLPVVLLNLLIRPAYAEANISIQSPAITAIRAAMEARFSQLEPYYQNGSIGMTRDGLIKIRDLNAIPLPKRKSINSLTADENRDRNNLYKEMATANGHPEWEAEIRSTFAKRWVDNAPAGWMYQDAGGNWVKK